MSLVTNLWRSIENPRFPLSQAADEWFGALASNSGVRVNSETALTYSPVWRGVFTIANIVGILPLEVLQRASDGEGKTIADRHPAYALLRRKPNEETTAFVFKRTMQAVAILEGNAYAYIDRRGDARPIQLISLLPGTCEPLRVSGVLWYLVNTPSGEQRKIPARDMLHIKGPGLDSLKGYKLTEKARHGIGMGMAAQEYSGRFFSNGAEPRVVLEHPKVLSPKAKENIREGWNRAHQGLENVHKVSILEEGMKVTAFGLDPQKSQLIEALQFSAKDVANWLLLPPHILGDDGKTAYASLEQENSGLLLHSIEPPLVNWEEECYDKLLSEDEKRRESYTMEFKRLALLRADALARSAFYHNMLQDGVMSRDEVRARENLNPMPNGEGKKYFMPLNMGIAGEGQTAEEKKFKRDVWLTFQKDGTVADVQANLTDFRELAEEVGLPLDPTYIEPFLPVVAANGPLVSGETIKDPDGDVVGGDTLEGSGGADSMPGAGGNSGDGPGEGEAQPKGGVEGQQQKAKDAGAEARTDAGEKSAAADAKNGGKSGAAGHLLESHANDDAARAAADKANRKPEDGEDHGARMITIRRATRQLLVDATRRMTKRLITHAEKAQKAQKMGEDWVAEHREMIHEAMEPAVLAYAAAGGSEIDPKATVDGFIGAVAGDVTVAGLKSPHDFKQICDGYDQKAAEHWVDTSVPMGEITATAGARSDSSAELEKLTRDVAAIHTKLDRPDPTPIVNLRMEPAPPAQVRIETPLQPAMENCIQNLNEGIKTIGAKLDRAMAPRRKIVKRDAKGDICEVEEVFMKDEV